MLISQIYHPRPMTISPQATIRECIVRLHEEGVNGLVVMDGDTMVGVISVQDIVGALVPEEFEQNVQMAMAMYKPHFFHESCESLSQQPVQSVMRKDFLKVDLETNILAVMADFLDGDLYIVPVMSGERLIGVITRTEMLRAVMEGMTLSADASTNV